MTQAEIVAKQFNSEESETNFTLGRRQKTNGKESLTDCAAGRAQATVSFQLLQIFVFADSAVQSVLRQFVNLFCSNFQKNHLTDFQKCRIALIRGALESSAPGASNVGSNVEI